MQSSGANQQVARSGALVRWLKCIRMCSMPAVRSGLAVGMSLSLVGCGFLAGENGYFRDRSMDYQNAKAVPQYDLGRFASEASLARIKSVRPIPEVAASGESFRPKSLDDVPRPQVIESVGADGRLQIYRGLEARWLWLETDPASAYVWLSQYFNNSGFIIKAGSTVGQFLETSWREGYLMQAEAGGFWSRSVASLKSLGNDSKAFERYRLWFTPTSAAGLRGARVIVVRQVGFAESFAGLPQPWPETLPIKVSEPLPIAEQKGFVDYPPIEWWSPLVDLLAGQLTEAAALAAKVEPAEGVVAQVREDGNGWPVLTIDQPFARSWDAIGTALARVKRSSDRRLTVEDLDRSLAVYYVKWMASGQSSEAIKYQLHVAKGEQGVLVSLQLDDENVAPRDQSEQVLSFVKAQLDGLGEQRQRR